MEQRFILSARWAFLYCRAETIPSTQVTWIQKNRGKLCASKNHFVHLLGVHWIFGSRKYMPHHTTQQCSGFPSPSTVITAPCEAPLYHSVQLPAHAHRKSRVCSNNAPTRKVYVTLVYLLLFAVELLCWATLVKISFTDLLPAITLADNTCLLDVYLHRQSPRLTFCTGCTGAP